MIRIKETEKPSKKPRGRKSVTPVRDVTRAVTPKAEAGKLCPTCGKLVVVAKSDAERQRAYRERKSKEALIRGAMRKA